MRKQKNNKQKLILVVGLVMTLILGYRGYQAGWFENNGTDNLGAVSASVSSTGGGIVKGAVSASASSPQPVITVNAWPNFEMKYDSVGNENNLVVKAEYSITAQGGKLYIPTWSLIEIQDSLGRYATPATKTELTALDPSSTTNCSIADFNGSCYIIPMGKTVRFSTKHTYNPKVMFGGVYNGKLPWFYFATATNASQIYYKAFPIQTSKLSTITIVGEKSPYIYTTAAAVAPGQTLSIKGVRLTGTSPTLLSSYPIKVGDRGDGFVNIIVDPRERDGVYSLYFTHPTYGSSNRAQITVASSPTVVEVVSRSGTNMVSRGERAVARGYNLIGSNLYLKGCSYPPLNVGYAYSDNGYQTISFDVDSRESTSNCGVYVVKNGQTSNVINVQIINKG